MFHDASRTLNFARADGPRRTPGGVLTATDRMVIELSRRDPAPSVAPPSRFFGRLFGARQPSALACPRLEALRRFAIHYRLRGDALPVEEHERLIEAGYGEPQISAIIRVLRDPRARTFSGQ